MADIVSEEKFCELLADKIEGEQWEQALTLFKECGPNLSFNVASVLWLATEQGVDKVQEVLDIVQRHYDRHLSFQDPEIRGTIKNGLLGVNPTEQLFLDIYTGTLGLTPNPA